MPRKGREISPTGVYHVMVRGIDRRDIFLDDQDRGKFMKVLRQVTNPKDNNDKPLSPLCNIHAYCLMDNHVHLLLAESEETVGEIMKRISVSYVSYFNKKYERLGPLFQGRFRSEVVGDAGYFIRLMRYIHQNPLRAHMVDSVSEFKWSSWQEYSMPERDGICCHKLPFSNIRWDEICSLAIHNCNSSNADRSAIDHHRMTDKEAVMVINRYFPEMNMRGMAKEDRRSLVKEVVALGVNRNQLARLLHVDYKTICRLLGKMP